MDREVALPEDEPPFGLPRRRPDVPVPTSAAQPDLAETPAEEMNEEH